MRQTLGGDATRGGDAQVPGFPGRAWDAILKWAGAPGGGGVDATAGIARATFECPVAGTTVGAAGNGSATVPTLSCSTNPC